METQTNYKILKLKSGEELIAQVIESSNEKILLERPMCFRFLMIQDYTGSTKEVIVAKNWAILSSDDKIEIPVDFVLSQMNPSKEAIKLYEAEKTKQDVQLKFPKSEEEDKIKLEQEKIKKEYDEMIGNLEQDEEFKKMMRLMSENAKNTVDEMTGKNKNKKDEEMIFMNMMFPPEILIDLIESEMIDPELFGEMYQDIKKNIKKKKPSKPKSKKPNMSEGNSTKYTGDQKDRADYGNKWTDWNPDLSSEEYH